MTDVLGQRIQEKRKAAGLTQQQLANRLGVKRRQVQRWESGDAEIGIKRLCQVANIVGVNVWVFVFGLNDLVEMPTPIPDAPLRRKPSLARLASKELPDANKSLGKKIVGLLKTHGAMDR